VLLIASQLDAALRRQREKSRMINSAQTLLEARDFRDPAILLSGSVDYNMYALFREKLDTAPEQGLVVVELTTLGGDPEVARILGEDVRFHSEVVADRRFVFLGKAAVYSAGTTFMSFFARENRYLTRGTRLMIHERKMDKQLHVEGPLTRCVANVEATLNEIRASIAIQNEGFENLIRKSSVSMDEVLMRAPSNWYVEANEALDRGLIAGII
jgi:ATP-dependent protease ClpP protease subunit